MKTIVATLTLIFAINGHASTALSSQFKEALDLYEYSITVEWDQKNQKELSRMNQEFSSELDELFENGLNSSDIKEALGSEKFSNVPGGLNKLQTIEWFKENSNELYQRGASWNATAIIFYGGVAAVFIGFFAYSTWYSNNYKCAGWVPTGPRNTCTEWIKK